jgi:hypothetical protein
VVKLRCFEKYLHVIILSACLFICPSSLYADSLTSLPSLPKATVALKPQRTIAPFAPTLRITSRILSEDTLWNGAVLVDGMVTVAAQATLTIMPGTIVRFDTDSGILVLGRIVAKGSAALPIILTSRFSEPVPSDWYGMVLTGTAKKNIFEQLKIHGAAVALYARSSSFELKDLHIENSSAAIKIADSIAYFKDLFITDCSTGISSVKSEIDLDSVVIEKGETAISLTSSSLTATKLKVSANSQSALVAEKSQFKIETSVFSGNLIGAMIIGSEGSFSNSKFIKNSDTAVILSGSLLKFSSNLVSGNKIGIQMVDNLPSIWGNSIYANSNYNILYLGEDILYAGGNWFDTASLELLNKSLFSKRPGAIKILPLLAAPTLSDQLKDL